MRAMIPAPGCEMLNAMTAVATLAATPAAATLAAVTPVAIPVGRAAVSPSPGAVVEDPMGDEEAGKIPKITKDCSN